MTTFEKAKVISKYDSIYQSDDGHTLEEWECLVSAEYSSAKGNGDGWIGIAEKDPMVIEDLFPAVERFITKYKDD